MLHKLILALLILLANVTVGSVIETISPNADGWNKIGLTDPSKPINLLLALKQENLDKIEDIYTKNSKEFEEMIKPTNQTSFMIKKWLFTNNIKPSQIEAVTSNGDFLQIRTTIGLVEKLLSVKYFDYENSIDSSQVISRIDSEQDYVVPDSIELYLDFISPTKRFPDPLESLSNALSTYSNNDPLISWLLQIESGDITEHDVSRFSIDDLFSLDIKSMGFKYVNRVNIEFIKCTVAGYFDFDYHQLFALKSANNRKYQVLYQSHANKMDAIKKDKKKQRYKNDDDAYDDNKDINDINLEELSNTLYHHNRKILNSVPCNVEDGICACCKYETRTCGWWGCCKCSDWYPCQCGTAGCEGFVDQTKC